MEGDLIQRLRERSQSINGEAADEIELLRSQLTRLLGAAEPFVGMAELIERDLLRGPYRGKPFSDEQYRAVASAVHSVNKIEK